MKFKISNTGNPFYNKGENKPLFYNAVLAKKWGANYQDTIKKCKELFINKIFDKATEYNGEIYQVIDYFTYEIVIEREGDKILSNRYIEMRLTNESYSKYYDVIKAEYITEAYVKLTIKCDLWVSYFEKIVFDENKWVEIKRRMPNRFNKDGRLDFALDGDNHWQDPLDAPKHKIIDEKTTGTIGQTDIIAYNGEGYEKDPILDSLSDNLKKYGVDNDGLYTYAILKSKKEFNRTKYFDPTLGDGFRNNYFIAPIFFSTEDEFKNDYPEIRDSHNVGYTWKNNNYQYLSTFSSEDLIDIIKLPFPPPSLLYWKAVSSEVKDTSNYANFQVGEEKKNWIAGFGGGSLLPYEYWIHDINEKIKVNLKLNGDFFDRFLKNWKPAAAIGNRYEEFHEPVYYHGNITSFDLETFKGNKTNIPIQYLPNDGEITKSLNIISKFNYNGATMMNLLKPEKLITNDENKYICKTDLALSLPSLANAWNDYMRNNKASFLTGIAKQAVDIPLKMFGAGMNIKGEQTKNLKKAGSGNVAGAIAGGIGASAESIFGIVDTINEVKQMKAKAGTNHQNAPTESTFLITLAAITKSERLLGYYRIYQPFQGLKRIIIHHARLFGNPINELKIFESWKTFQTRIFWNFWKIKDPYFTFEIDDIPQGLDDYFTEILKEIRVFPIQEDGSTKLNDYFLENWELEMVGY